LKNNFRCVNVSCKYVYWYETALLSFSEEEKKLMEASFLKNFTNVPPGKKREIVVLICDRAGSKWGQEASRDSIVAAYGAFRMVHYSITQGDQATFGEVA
jgi:hypothetical protein